MLLSILLNELDLKPPNGYKFKKVTKTLIENDHVLADLTLIRLGFLNAFFSGGGGQFDPLSSFIFQEELI